jgi:hypothetical protein
MAPAGPAVVVAGGEGLADTAEGNAHLGLHAGRLRFQHGCMVAPGQKLGVTRHVGDQGEHFFGLYQIRTDLWTCFIQTGFAAGTLNRPERKISCETAHCREAWISPTAA